MNEDEKRVAELIHDAFRGVELGNGIGLMEAEGLDDYADTQTLEDYRSQDEKKNWSLIPLAKLNSCRSSLSFFDAEGMRFHLPAFLIAALEDTLESDVVFHLTFLDDDAASRFALLSASQRSAVRAFLQLHLSQLPEPNRDFEGPMIEKALSEYWTTTTE